MVWCGCIDYRCLFLSFHMQSQPQKLSKAEKRRRKRQSRQRKATPKTVVAVRGQLQHSSAAQAALLAASKNSQYWAKALVWAMADPSLHGMRIPTQYPCPTALVKNIVQFTATATTTAAPGFNAGDLLFAHIGQPACQLMYYTTLTQVNYFAGFASNVAGASGPTDSMLFAFPSLSANASVDYPLMIDVNPINYHSGAPASPTYPVGTNGAYNYTFLNPTDSLFVNITSPTNSALKGTIDYEVCRWGDEEIVVKIGTSALLQTDGVILNFSFQPSTASAGITTAGWYRVKLLGFRADATTPGASQPNMTIRQYVAQNAGSGWKLVPSPDLMANTQGDALIGVSCRSAGSSLLVTNTTAMLNRQGTVLAARIQGDINPCELNATALSGFAEKYTGDAALGCYTFKEIVEFNDSFKTASDPVSGYLGFPLERVGDYTHLIQVSCPSPSTMANTYTVSVGYALEFKTTCPRYATALADSGWNDAIEARRAVASVPQWFYENPRHMAALYNLAQSVYRGAMKAVPYLTKVGRVLAPEFAPVYAGLDYMSRRNADSRQYP